MNEKDLIEFEAEIAETFDRAEIPFPVHLSGGNESELIELFNEVKQGDWIFSTHRPHYHYLLAGGSPERLKAEITRGNSMYLFDPDLRFYSSAIVSGGTAIAAGTALSIKRNSSPEHVWCFLGDGAEDSGHFYEAARYVQGHDLPATFVIEDNDRSVETPTKERYGNYQVDWPSCVRRLSYTPTWPHIGTGNWVDFSGEGKGQGDEKPGASF